MTQNENYPFGLLNLIYLLIKSDGEISTEELDHLKSIRQHEKISDEVFDAFQASIIGKTERQIYQNGIELINSCTDDVKLKTFVRLYQMAQADGVIHVKEVRLLLYAVRLSDVDINKVIRLAAEEENFLNT